MQRKKSGSFRRGSGISPLRGNCLLDQIIVPSWMTGSRTDCQSWQLPQKKNQPSQTFLAVKNRRNIHLVSPENTFSDFNWYPPLLHPKERIYPGEVPTSWKPYTFLVLQHKVKDLISNDFSYHRFALTHLHTSVLDSYKQAAQKSTQTRNDTSSTLNEAEILLTTGYIDK